MQRIDVKALMQKYSLRGETKQGVRPLRSGSIEEKEEIPSGDVMSLSYEEFIKANLAVKIRSHLLGEVIFLVSSEEAVDQVEADYVCYLPDEVLALQSLTPEEIAGYLQISPRTIESWVWRGKIPHIKIGRCVRFDLGQIQEWLKAKTVGAMDTQSTAHQA